jgi:hypothetical protein
MKATVLGAALADRQLQLDRTRTKRFPELLARKLERMIRRRDRRPVAPRRAPAHDQLASITLAGIHEATYLAHCERIRELRAARSR